MIEDPVAGLDILIKVLVAVVLVLLSILLYRIDRVMASTLSSTESLERAVDNIEHATETLSDFTNLISKLPFVGRRRNKRDVEVQ